MDTESLKFTQRLLQQAYSTITLSIKRQIPGNAANPSPSHLGSGGVTATHPLVSPSGHMSYNFNPHSIMGAHNVEIDGGRGGVSGSGREKRIRPPNLIPISKKKVGMCLICVGLLVPATWDQMMMSVSCICTCTSLLFAVLWQKSRLILICADNCCVCIV